ncbi:MarR family winged helix-turn-helix transcriptional regulator [Variovorax ginsengisoli]|uniref:MarR family transcriptional regulator n=1 Tax=Variovorax ginsengisoli TaxID=363844 RepID=A0ABT8S162_9BURK|nr:MarR family transcriptional regulator [Variovorax ginsengisoli]MDN8613395.1 MarR family transcriptional regulator [Variovorax ginsengisoli]MDO1532565.1 MarR family transcriptional regulator [Variovorax ginsengisoli]
MPANTRKKTPAPAPVQAHLELREALGGTLAERSQGLQADPLWGNSDVLIGQWRTQFARDEVDPLTFGIRIRRIAMLLDEASALECDKAGLTLNEMLLLMALRRVGPPYALRPTDILKMHSVTSGTATYRIDQLTKQDLAERIPDPSDRRGYLIRLTPRGLEIIDGILQRLMVEHRRLLAPMSDIPGAFEVFEESLRLYERCIGPRE